MCGREKVRVLHYLINLANFLLNYLFKLDSFNMHFKVVWVHILGPNSMIF